MTHLLVKCINTTSLHITSFFVARLTTWTVLCTLDSGHLIRMLPLYVFSLLVLCLCVGYDQQSAAFNEEDGKKINIVPWKMISSHPIIESHFHLFIVWERIYGSTKRERKLELLHQCTTFSPPLFLPVTTAVLPEPLTIEKLKWYSCTHNIFIFWLKPSLKVQALFPLVIQIISLTFPASNLKRSCH